VLKIRELGGRISLFSIFIAGLPACTGRSNGRIVIREIKENQK
jgi:hypothetical protein